MAPQRAAKPRKPAQKKKWPYVKIGHVPTPATRNSVRIMRACHQTIENIAAAIGIAPHTLNKHYAEELASGAAEINLAVVRTWFLKATGGGAKGNWKQADVNAMKWWTVINMGAKEQQEVRHTGPNGGPITLEALIMARIKPPMKPDEVEG